MRILIMAGGTGGHIFPALSVALRLQQQGHSIEWLGTKNGMEAGITAANNIKLNSITISGLRGKGLISKLLAPFKLSIALLQAMLVIARFKPDVVLGMGGYVTGPAGLAAWLLRKKLVIHEQNAIAGMTNQILAKFSYRVLEAFPNSFPQQVNAKLTGNPVREEFHKLLAPEKRINKNHARQLKILVLGGSGGAATLNNIVPQLLKSWGDNKPMIWHQAGSKHFSNAQQAYLNNGITVATQNPGSNDPNVKLVDFIRDMPNAYAWADIVICRAGALTIAELAAAGVASILIPYPYAVDDHQTKNAQYLVQANAAILLPERDLNLNELNKVLQELANNPAKLLTMAQAAYKKSQPAALDSVVEGCLA